MQEESLPKVKYAYIIGIGRSGTTILTKILNRHPQIHCLPEANFLVFFLNKFKNDRKVQLSDLDEIFEQIATYALSHPWVGWDFDLNATKALVTEKCKQDQGLHYNEVCRLIYRNFKVTGMDKDAATLFVDKNPSYTIYTDHISNAFPDAKFIFLVRDYRANILSRKQSVYLKSPDVAFNAARWKLFNSSAFTFLKNNNDKVLLLRYEDLIRDSAKEFNRMFTFLGFDEKQIATENASTYDVDFADYDLNPKYKERFEKKYADLNKPLNEGRLNSWETQLSKDEIKIADAICGDFSKQFGYEPFFTLNWLSKAGVRLNYFPTLLKAFIDVKKDRLIYYLPTTLKLKRFKESYLKLGFIKK